MKTNLITIRTYKQKRMLNGLSVAGYTGILINVALAMLVAAFLSLLFFNPPEAKLLGNAVSIGIEIFALYHFLKVVHIVKNREILTHLSYLIDFVLMMTILSGLFSLFSFIIITPIFVSMKVFLIFQSIFIPNIFLLFYLYKKEKC